MVHQLTNDIFESIIMQMPEGIVLLDANDIIQLCNPATEKIRRVKAQRIIGKSIFHLHPPKMHHRIKELIDSLKSGTVAMSNRIINERNRYLDNSYSAIRDSSGNYLGTLLISRDITEKKRLSDENVKLKTQPAPADTETFLVDSPSIKKMFDMAEAVAVLDSTVLVTGENGTGKELIVETVHRLSRHRDGALIRVNCAAIPQTLIESELFGHTKGAFTGATEDRKGKFELAHNGTLFLDEIGEVPLESQAKLLRAIQAKTIQPVGGRKEIKIDVRIIAATNRDLQKEVATGLFREDLYSRLNVINIEVPPLRERREEIIPLAEHFIEGFCKTIGKSNCILSPQVRNLLYNHLFPGNIRQLKHAMERAVALCKGDMILPDDLPPEMTCQEICCGPSFTQGQKLKEALAFFEKEYLQQALMRHGYKKTATATALGISRKSLWEKLNRHQLDTIDLTTLSEKG